MLQSRTLEEMSASVAARLRDLLGLDMNTPGRVVQTFAMAILDELAVSNSAMQAAHLGQFPTKAYGLHLDFIGETYGVSRLGSTKAFVDAADKNAVLSTTDGSPLRGKIGDTIQSGTRFSDITNTKIYFTPISLTVPPDASAVSITIQASAAGSGSNLGPGELTSHPYGASVSLTNLVSIDSGLDPESDANYKNRLLEHIRARSGNYSAIRAAALSIPGVGDVVLRSGAYGINTVALMVIPVTDIISRSVVDAVRSAVIEVAPLGTNILVQAPTYRQVEIDAMIEFSTPITRASADSIANNAVSIMLTALGRVPLSGTLNLQDVYRDIIVRFNPNINKINSVCIKIDGEKIMSGILKLGTDELFVARPISKPIKFLHGIR